MNKVRNTSTLVSNLNNMTAAAEEGVTSKSIPRAPRMSESIAAKLKEKLCYMLDHKCLSLRDAASKLGLSVTKAKELLKDTATRQRLVAQNSTTTTNTTTSTTSETSSPSQSTQPTSIAQGTQQQQVTTPAQLVQLLTNGVMNCVQYQYTINIDTVIEMIYCLPGLPPMSMQTLIQDTITTDMVFTYLDSPANDANQAMNTNSPATTATTTTITPSPSVSNNNQTATNLTNLTNLSNFTNYAGLLAAAATMGSLPSQSTSTNQMAMANAPLSPTASGGVLPQIGLWN